MERARRTRSRIIVADTSTAGTSITRPIAGCRGGDAPGRANTTTSASAGSASTWYQAASSAAASAPSNNANRFPGSRSANACSVRTVYDGAGSASSMRSTLRRGLPATARSNISARCSGPAWCAARLNGWTRAGRNRTLASSASPAASAATRCPTCTGSNEPPNRASTRGQDGVAVLESAGQLLVDGERRFAVRRIQLRFPPQPQVRIARSQQGQGGILAGRVLIRDLAKLMGRLNAVPRLEVTLGEMVSHVGQLGLAGPQLVGEPAERYQRLAEVPAAKLGACLRQLDDRIRGGHDAGSMVAGRQERGAGDEQKTQHGPHGRFGGDGASALPRALIFSWARWVMVSPGAPPPSACWE